uniref:HDC14951 n=1 Tax=Drosophila melanogaster TaxID=7227 RepID=Q6IJG5_DROME|nr:TPA_inf: HDC14951 [Drosophila melanogaster]
MQQPQQQQEQQTDISGPVGRPKGLEVRGMLAIKEALLGSSSVSGLLAHLVLGRACLGHGLIHIWTAVSISWFS